jgi:sec-independent protein translocase protein TatA
MSGLQRPTASRAGVCAPHDDHQALRGSMGRIGIPELLIILAIIILIFGANRLPEIGRGIGRGIRNFKESTKEGAESENTAEKS